MVNKQAPRIGSIIYKNPKYDDFEKLNEARDVIQHKNIMRAMRVRVGSKPVKILIPKDPETLVPPIVKLGKNQSSYGSLLDINSIQQYGFHEQILHHGYDLDKDYYEPIDFCDKHIDFICETFSDTFNRIQVELLRKHIGRITNYCSNQSVAVYQII